MGQMREEQRHRAVTAFQAFLGTPFEEQLRRHQTTSPESAALALFRDVVAHVPAYRAFLAEQGISDNSIQTLEDFVNLPLITKNNYHSRYPLTELCRNGRLDMCDAIAVSSGSTGKPTFWHRFFTDELQIATRIEELAAPTPNRRLRRRGISSVREFDL
jgi:phenylacetate-CoA ligase